MSRLNSNIRTASGAEGGSLTFTTENANLNVQYQVIGRLGKSSPLLSVCCVEIQPGAAPGGRQIEVVGSDQDCATADPDVPCTHYEQDSRKRVVTTNCSSDRATVRIHLDGLIIYAHAAYENEYSHKIFPSRLLTYRSLAYSWERGSMS